MDFNFSDIEQQFCDTVCNVVERYIDPLVEKYPADRPLPKEAMLELYGHLGKLGLTSARTPESDGGSGLGHFLLGVSMELLPAFLGMSLVGHESTVRRISMASNPGVSKKYLPDLIAGKRLSGSATSEPNVGSDPRSIETRATREGDWYVLNGRKLWTTNGAVADVVVVVASLGRDDSGRNLITRIVVDRDESPFSSAEVPVLGLQRGHLGELSFEDCRVPAENVLGAPGDAHQSLTATWLGNRPCLGLIGVGLAQRSLDAAIAYSKERQQFGRPIGGFQLVQEMLADMVIDVTASRLVAYKALKLLDAGEWAALETSMAKYMGTEAAIRVTSNSIQIHGSSGLTRWLPIEEWYRDARMLPLPDGTNQIQQLIMGRELTGQRAFG